MELAPAGPWVLVAIVGFLIGCLVGLTGVGAGALTTPVLISGFGVHPAVAVGTDLLFAAITKGSAAWRHHSLGNVDWRIVGWLGLGSLSAASATLGWLYWAEPDTAWLAERIRQLLAAALVVSALAIPVYAWRNGGRGATAGEVAARPLPTVLLGLVLGTLVTLTSVGAGAIGVAVLTGLYPALRARRVVGTDIVHAIPLTFLSGMGHLGMGNVDWRILVALLVGSVPGIAVGSRITGLAPDWLLRSVLSIVLLYAAYVLVG